MEGRVMKTITLTYILILFIEGLLSYFYFAQQQSLTALIPSFAALFLFLSYLYLPTKWSMPGLMALSTLLLLGCIPGVIKWFGMIQGATVARPSAVTIQAITALIALIYMILSGFYLAGTKKSCCNRSF